MTKGKWTAVLLMTATLLIVNVGHNGVGAIKCFVCTDTIDCKTGFVNFPTYTEVAGCDYCKIAHDSMNSDIIMHTCEHNTAGMKGCPNPGQWTTGGRPAQCCCLENLCNVNSCSPDEFYRASDGAVNVRKPITVWMLVGAAVVVGLATV